MSSKLYKAIQWLGGHELIVLVAFIIVVTGTWGFIELADEVLEGETQAIDEKIVLFFREPDNLADPIGPEWCAEIGRDLTALGGYAVLVLVTFGVVGFLALDRKYATMWFLLGAVVSGYLLGMGLKAYFDRPRPDLVPHLSHISTTSFPSGHAMMSAVVYLTLGAILANLVTERPLKFYFLAVALFTTGLVGISRVYMGVHYPTDVLAGWSAGLVWATFCWLIARWFKKRGILDADV